MRIYIEYFQSRNTEISSRLKKLTTPVAFRPIITAQAGRLGYGVLEYGDEKEMQRVKQNLVDIINEELTEEGFVEKIKEENKNTPENYNDPILGTPITVFEQKDSNEILRSLSLDKYED